LPAYDHDNLGECFYAVKRYIDSVPFREPEWEERPFIGVSNDKVGQLIQVGLEPKWLHPSWEMFVGVDSSLGPEEVIRLITKQGLLDMKIASTLTVEKIVKGGRAGLSFTPNSQPPRALPNRQGLVYFQINRTPPEEWDNVQKALTLAVWLNPSRIEGSIQG